MGNKINSLTQNLKNLKFFRWIIVFLLVIGFELITPYSQNSIDSLKEYNEICYKICFSFRFLRRVEESERRRLLSEVEDKLKCTKAGEVGRCRCNSCGKYGMP